MTKLFVGGLPYAVNEEELNDLFSEYGKIVSAIVITDRSTGRSKGFGFVEIEDDAQAQKAVEEMNGKSVGGRTIVVSVARPREER